MNRVTTGKPDASKASAFALIFLLAAALIAGLTSPGPAYSQKKPAAKKPAPVLKPAPAAPTPTPYNLGYQKGYSDGFTAGGNDWNRGVPRDYEKSDAYQRRESAYDPAHGDNEEYRTAYQLGFELGHTDGYYGRARNAAVPANAAVLAKAAALARAQKEGDQDRDRGRNQDRSRNQDRDRPQERDRSQERDNAPPRQPTPSGQLSIPAGTDLQIRLTTPISTKTNRVGDRFSAVVVSPAAYQDAEVEGHISALEQSGRVSGRTEMSLQFDTITFTDGRQSPLTADLQRVIESESVKNVDEEGRVQTGSRTRDSQVRGGVGAAAGAVIGGIAGGAKGAILGAIIGGAAGVGTVYVEGNKELIFGAGTELVIRTANSSSR
ncbi:MAG TPA: hypothetical protein VNH22_05470 [Blastocatellia bacterium]|jgi:Ni/Co efflux regulator RcnB|nr:hypothetical protein [Blastocatellia bacterium]